MEDCRWEELSRCAWNEAAHALSPLTETEARTLEEEWRDHYPTLQCLINNRYDSDVIHACAERLIREGVTPCWFDEVWNNRGNGIPAVTLRALEFDFLALYRKKGA